MKSNCMPWISLIYWVWYFALFWQLISCYELSSCHKKVLIPEMDWGTWNLTVCQKLIWLIEFEILPYFNSLSVVTSCQVVKKKFYFRNWLRDSQSNCLPKFSLIGWVWNSPYFDSLSVVTSCQAVIKKFLLQKLILGNQI